MLNLISNALKGAVLGLAMIIPGISGGTLALMLGIYERLIRALRNFSPSTLKDVSKLLAGPERKSRAAALWGSHDMSFLAVLLAGALLSVFAFSHLIEDLLSNHPRPTYGFFFGLVAASIVFPFRLAERKSVVELFCALLALGLTIALTGSTIEAPEKLEGAGSSAQIANEALDYARFAVCGILASSAMLLPGISGSFLLLLLGIYHDVLRMVNERDYLLLAVFIGGCLLGLALFARLIHFLLNRFHSPTMAFLGGLMAGSLWKLWPFKDPSSGQPAWPGAGEDSAGISLLACLGAVAIIAAFARHERKTGEKAAADQSIGR